MSQWKLYLCGGSGVSRQIRRNVYIPSRYRDSHSTRRASQTVSDKEVVGDSGVELIRKQSPRRKRGRRSRNHLYRRRLGRIALIYNRRRGFSLTKAKPQPRRADNC